MDKQELQLYSTELSTGKTIRLTDSIHTETQWGPWCSKTPPEVLDHRSALNTATDEVLYFDGNRFMKRLWKTDCFSIILL